MVKKDNSCRKNNSPIWLQRSATPVIITPLYGFKGQLIAEIITPPIYIHNEGRLS